MTDPLTCSLIDRAAAILARADRAAIPLPELADRLGATADELRRHLNDDSRFVLVAAPPFPDLTTLAPGDRDAYAAALRQAGVLGEPCVALTDPDDPGPVPPLDRLLRNSVARLLGRTADPALLAASERLRTALSGLGATPADSAPLQPAGTAPSTTPLPGPHGSAKGPPRRLPPSLRPPRYRGSRRE